MTRSAMRSGLLRFALLSLVLTLLVGPSFAPPTLAESALTYNATADAYADEAWASSNFGTSSSLLADAYSESGLDLESYLQFDVAGIAGTLQSAKLRVYLYNGSSDGPAVYATTNSWSETGITWSNRPARSSAATDDKGAVSANSWVEYDVTSVVKGDGTYSFVLATSSSDGVDFYSREGSMPPQLVLTTDASPATTPTPTNAPTTGAGSDLTRTRAFTAASAWNTPIGSAPVVDRYSSEMIATIGQSGNGGVITSDTTQYSFPIYYADASTPRWNVPCALYKCTIVKPDGSTTSTSMLENVPIPPDAKPSNGYDGQMIVVDQATGTEYDLFEVQRTTTGWTASNGSVYNFFWDGTPPHYGSRGAGVPYLAGLIRPWEIAQGHIDHAIGFSYQYPRQGPCVFPASKTDGQSSMPYAIPEGARLQLDPSLTEADFDRMGLDRTGKIIARTLQQYGMILVAVSGKPKIYAENLVDNPYAQMQWSDPSLNLTSTTISKIPYTAYRVLALPDAYWTGGSGPTHGDCYAYSTTAAPQPAPTGAPTPTVAPTSTPVPTSTSATGTLTFKAEADARVAEAYATTNYGRSSSLRTVGGTDPDVESYLRFTVSGVAGPVQSAKLRVYATTDTAQSPRVYTASSTWTETSVTWNSRLARSSSPIAETGAITVNSWVEYPVAAAVTGNGTYTFVLATDSRDGVYFSSREGSQPPQLVVTFGSTP